MPPKNKKEKAPGISVYLEVYINEDGSLVFMPLTQATCATLEAIATDCEVIKERSGNYCG